MVCLSECCHGDDGLLRGYGTHKIGPDFLWLKCSLIPCKLIERYVSAGLDNMIYVSKEYQFSELQSEKCKRLNVSLRVRTDQNPRCCITDHQSIYQSWLKLVHQCTSGRGGIGVERTIYGEL